MIEKWKMRKIITENSAMNFLVSWQHGGKGTHNGLQNFHYLIKGNIPVRQETFFVPVIKFNSISYMSLF